MQCLTGRLLDELWSFNLKIFWAICLCKQSSAVLLTNHPKLDLKDVLNFKFSVLTVSRFMSCSMSYRQKLCQVKIFQLHSMSNAIRCINQCFEFESSVFLCLTLIYNLSNLRTTILHSKKQLQDQYRLQNTWTNIHFFLQTDKNPCFSG